MDAFFNLKFKEIGSLHGIFFKFFSNSLLQPLKKDINYIDITSSSGYIGKDIRNYRDTRSSGEGGTVLARSLPLQASDI